MTSLAESDDENVNDAADEHYPKTEQTSREQPADHEPTDLEPPTPEPEVSDKDAEAFEILVPAVDLHDGTRRQYVTAFLRRLHADDLTPAEALDFMNAFAATSSCDITGTRRWDKASIQAYFEFWGLSFDGKTFDFTPREVDVAMKFARPVESRLNKLRNAVGSSPIDALKIHWPAAGLLSWEPYSVKTGDSVIGTKAESVRVRGESPDNHWEDQGGAVTLVEARAFQWGTVVALEIRNTGSKDHTIETSWVKVATPEASSIRLVDLKSKRSYWPLDSNLGGVISTNQRDVRLVVFEPFEQPTSAVAVETREVKVSQGTGGKDGFRLKLSGDVLWRATQVAVRSSSNVVELEQALRRHHLRG